MHTQMDLPSLQFTCPHEKRGKLPLRWPSLWHSCSPERRQTSTPRTMEKTWLLKNRNWMITIYNHHGYESLYIIMNFMNYLSCYLCVYPHRAMAGALPPWCFEGVECIGCRSKLSKPDSSCSWERLGFYGDVSNWLGIRTNMGAPLSHYARTLGSARSLFSRSMGVISWRNHVGFIMKKRHNHMLETGRIP